MVQCCRSEAHDGAGAWCVLQEELMVAMGLATEADGSMEKVFRQGFKNSTWWVPSCLLSSCLLVGNCMPQFRR